MKEDQATPLLLDYHRQIGPTDKLPSDQLGPVLLGLFGEVGSIMATAKKLHREGDVFSGYSEAVIEEFGDVLWYLSAIARRLDMDIEDLFSIPTNIEEFESRILASDLRAWPISVVSRAKDAPTLDSALFKLGEMAAVVLSLATDSADAKEVLRRFVTAYLHALQAAQMTFGDIVKFNLSKTLGRFVAVDPSALPSFDSDFDDEERIPSHFELHITQRKSGKTYIRWNGVFIGDPLTDNIRDPDGYRFHDVFHFAHAAVLHWSPVFRALIKHKRKSVPRIDEAQDGGRAIVIEEGLTAWIFARAKKLNLFENHASLSFDLLKTIQQFVNGYEVEQCPLKLWEDAILQGYAVFRKVLSNSGGIVIGDRESRTITYKHGTGR